MINFNDSWKKLRHMYCLMPSEFHTKEKAGIGPTTLGVLAHYSNHWGPSGRAVTAWFTLPRSNEVQKTLGTRKWKSILVIVTRTELLLFEMYHNIICVLLLHWTPTHTPVASQTYTIVIMNSVLTLAWLVYLCGSALSTYTVSQITAFHFWHIANCHFGM